MDAIDKTGNGLKLENISRLFWPALYFTLIVYHGIIAYRLIASPAAIQVQYIPDDGYYYLTLVKNFIQTHIWTFDTSTVTSGFQVLWAYLLAALYWVLKPTDNQFINLSLLLNSSITIIVALFIGWDLYHQRASFEGYLVGTILISSRNFIFNSFSITEWSLVVLCAYLVITRWDKPGRASFITLLIAAFIGPLARSDFILLPSIIIIISLGVTLFERKPINWRRVAAVIGASTLGFLLVGLNSYIFTGKFLQSSALVKAYWAKVLGLSTLRAMLLTSDLLGFDQLGVIFGVVVFVSISVFTLYFLAKALVLHGKTNIRLLQPTIVVAGIFFGYSMMYSYNGAIQPWYTGYLLVPIWLLGMTMIKFIWKNYAVWVRIMVSLVAIGWISFNINSTAALNSKNAPWPHQAFMLEVVRYIQEQGISGSIASWNAGIAGYYLDGRVINVDGLVNNDVFEYIKGNNLYGYFIHKKVSLVVDYVNMIDEFYYRSRGGYSDDRLISHLKQVRSFGSQQYFWKQAALYHFIP